MIKMVVTDMDGTLLDKNSKISETNLQMIRELQSKGILFTVATGRCEQLIKEYKSELQLQLPAILYNGSIIMNLDNNDYIYKESINKTIALEIANYLQSKNVVYMLYTSDAIHTIPNERWDYFNRRKETLPIEQQSTFKRITTNEEIIGNNDIPKILILEENEEKKDHLYDQIIKYPGITVSKSSSVFIDINPENTSKGDAVKYLAAKHNIEMTDVLVLGDQDNDHSMFDVAGYTVATNNAIEPLKQRADFITKNCYDDGFEHALRKLIEM